MKESENVLKEGLQYLTKLHKVDPVNPKLGAEVLYNFVCIGIESVLTGVLMAYDAIVDHSGVLQLLRELEKKETVNAEWIETARLMNRFQSYCSLDKVEVKIPNAEELTKIVALGKEIEAYGLNKLEE